MTDIVILNARVITMMRGMPFAEALAVTGKCIKAVGDTETIKALVTP